MRDADKIDAWAREFVANLTRGPAIRERRDWNLAWDVPLPPQELRWITTGGEGITPQDIHDAKRYFMARYRNHMDARFGEARINMIDSISGLRTCLVGRTRILLTSGLGEHIHQLTGNGTGYVTDNAMHMGATLARIEWLEDITPQEQAAKRLFRLAKQDKHTWVETIVDDNVRARCAFTSLPANPKTSRKPSAPCSGSRAGMSTTAPVTRSITLVSTNDSHQGHHHQARRPDPWLCCGSRCRGL
jgi:hypothetical protein